MNTTKRTCNWVFYWVWYNDELERPVRFETSDEADFERYLKNFFCPAAFLNVPLPY